MKKILISLILALALTLSSCQLPQNAFGSSDSSDTGSSASSGSNQNSSSSGSVSSCGNDKASHTDADNNDNCDLCGVSVVTEINFFVMNDFHGKIADSDTQPGIDELSLYLKNLTAEYPNSVLLSTGDMWQGGAESNLTKGLLVTEWMNELNFVSMTLGNHEYDWGEEYIEENAILADFPLLAINVYDRDTNQRVDYCEPSVMVERDGVQIGIIGAIGDCYSSISSDKCENVYFKTGSSLTALVKAESQRLKANGADLIVYSIHDGYDNSSTGGSISNSKLSSYYDTSLSSGNYVDIVFEGHTHQTYSLLDSSGVYHLQGGGDNSAFVHANVKVNLANGSDKTNYGKIISKNSYQSLADDPYIDELLEKYSEYISKAYEILGYNPSFIRGNALKQKIADLYYELGERVWGDEYDIALGGGYISIRSPYNLYTGNVTYADLMMLFPFDNDLVLCSIKGYDLRRKFFETTNSDYYISYGEYGTSIKNNINDNATYYVLVDTYTAYYKYNNLTIIERYDSETFARDLLAEYIKNGGLE